MITTIITVALVFSIFLNFALGWYTTKLIKFVGLTSQDMETFKTGMKEYQEHLNTVYELPTYYGDETLRSLLQHTKDVNESVKGFIEINNEMMGNDNG